MTPRSLYEFPYWRSCQSLNPRDQNKVDGFEQRRKLSQPAEVIEREQQARAADVEHVQEPAQQEPEHTDGCGPVAPLDHFRFQDVAGHVVVVVGDVLEDEGVADELDHGAKDARERDAGQEVFSGRAVA